MCVSFGITAGGFLLVHGLLVNPDIARENMIYFLVVMITREIGAKFPLYSGVWRWLREISPLVVMLCNIMMISGIILYSLRQKRIGVLSFIKVFAIFSLLYWTFSPWWLLISVMVIPLVPGEKSRLWTATRSFLLYLFFFLVICLVALAQNPSLGSSVIYSDELFLHWPYYAWLGTGFVAFVFGQVILLSSGFPRDRDKTAIQ